MRKATAIFLLFLFLFGSLVPVQVQEDLAELPYLLQHFQEHKQSAPETLFFQYLRLHYGDKYSQHQNTHDHSKLPFKGEITHLHAPIATLQSWGLSAIVPPVVEARSTPFSTDQAYTLMLYMDIWQPPRVLG